MHANAVHVDINLIQLKSINDFLPVFAQTRRISISKLAEWRQEQVCIGEPHSKETVAFRTPRWSRRYTCGLSRSCRWKKMHYSAKLFNRCNIFYPYLCGTGFATNEHVKRLMKSLIDSHDTVRTYAHSLMVQGISENKRKEKKISKKSAPAAFVNIS